MKLLVIIVLAVLFTTVSAHHGGCESEWEFFKGKCYYVYQYQIYTYEESKTICECKGGSLVKIENADENLYLYGFSRDNAPLWIGANDRDSEGNWQWEDGSQLSYSAWYTNEPNNYNGNEDCACIMKIGKKWNDGNCGQRKGFICQKYPDTKCQQGWESFNGHCYLVSEEPTHSYQEAQAVCENSCSNLVIVNNADEQLFIEGFSLNKYNIWIGLNDIAKEGEWKWEDNSLLSEGTYSNWKSNEPNNYGNEDCVHLYKDHNDKWNDDKCYKKLGYICEKE